MLAPVLPMFEEAANAYTAAVAVAAVAAAAKIQQAEKHIEFHNNNHQG